MKYKIFKERASLYDHLVQTNPYIHGIYQVCKAQFTLFLVYLIFRDSYRAGRPRLDLSNDAVIFGDVSGLLLFLVLEVFQLCITILLYPMFLVWSFSRRKVGVVSDYFYFLFLSGCVVLKLSMLYAAVSTGRMSNFHRLCAVLECSMVIMKTISFVSENGYKVCHPWSKDDEQGPALWYGGQMSPKVASFSQYMYFLVAPTLLYRDYYPRNKGSINLRNVAGYASQFVIEYLLARVLIYELQYPKSFKFYDLSEMFMIVILASPLTNILASIQVLHAFLNLQAELTRFADREFYLNWWSAVGYTEFYRLWNVPVHDFTTFYIYGMLKPYVPRALAGLVVFTLSAFMHDFILGVALGFFLPVFLILFAIIGGTVFASGVKFSKYLTFLLTCVGYVLYQTVYYLEVGARTYCPDPELSYFSVHSPHCFLLHNNVTIPSWW